MTRVDVTVRGGGIIGLCVAWAAVSRGARVRVIETHAIGAGASGGLVGALTPHTPEGWNAKKAFQLDSLLMAQGFWDGVALASNLPTGYARLGRIQPIADAEGLALAHARVQAAADLWQGRATWQVRAALPAPYEPASPTGYVIEDTLSARLHPRMALAALLAALRGAGADVVVGRDAPDQGAVIWATGVAGLAALGLDLGRNMGAGVKGQAALLRCDLGDVPQIYAANLHMVPHIDGTLAIGSTSENAWDDAQSTDARLDALIDQARALLPAARTAPVLERWAGLRPRATTRAPLLGPWPGRAGHFIANGGFKIGYGMAPKMAQSLMDLVLNGRDTIPAAFKIEKT